MKHNQKIEQLLEEKGWSMLELARRANVGREQARRLARRIPPSVLGATQIAKALGVSADWLFDDEQGWVGGGLPAGDAVDTKRPHVDIALLRRELRKLVGLPER